MKLDTVLDVPLSDVPERARHLHRMGFDGVYTQEANRDPFFPLLLAAQATPLDIYPNVAIAFPRSPMHMAYTAFDLQRAAEGRFALGIGSQIRPHIEKRFSARFGQPVTHMRELVEALNAIFATFHSGERLDVRGEYYTHTLMTPTFIPQRLDPYSPPPIWVGALGPRMTRMAAEVAGGVAIHPFNTPHFLETVTQPAIDAGLANRANALGFTRIVDVIPCVFSDEQERQRAVAGCRSNLAFYASTPSYRVTLDAHGWGELQPELHRLTKEGRWADMPALISDELLEAVCPLGTPAEVAAELHRRYGGLAERLALSIPYAIPDLTLAALVKTFQS